MNEVDVNFSYKLIHKHSPISVFDRLDWLRNFPFEKYISKIFFNTALRFFNSNNKINNADFVIQSGAPVYWCNIKAHCFKTEWYEPFFQLIENNNKKIRFLNIAAGSCQPYDYDSNSITDCPNCSAYIKDLTKKSFVTTVRDELSKKTLGDLGFKVKKIPCPALFSIGKKMSKKKFIIALNYMKIGGHYNLSENNVDSEKWKKVFINTYKKLIKIGSVIIVCHNKIELSDVRKILPHADYFYSNNYVDYLNLYSQVRFGIYNRVHSAFATASAGSPSYVIGNDSRAKMVAELGLTSCHINDVDDDKIDLIISELQKMEYKYQFKINQIKRNAKKHYLELFNKVFLNR